MYPPRTFRVSPQCGSPKSEGQLKFFVCQANGVPAARYRWIKDGTYVTQASLNTQWILYGLKRADAGFYQCSAKNSEGSIVSQGCHLSVACKFGFLTVLNDKKKSKNVLFIPSFLFPFYTKNMNYTL